MGLTFLDWPGLRWRGAVYTAVEGELWTTQCPVGGTPTAVTSGCPVVASSIPFDVIGFDKVSTTPERSVWATLSVAKERECVTAGRAGLRHASTAAGERALGPKTSGTKPYILASLCFSVHSSSKNPTIPRQCAAAVCADGHGQ